MNWEYKGPLLPSARTELLNGWAKGVLHLPQLTFRDWKHQDHIPVCAILSISPNQLLQLSMTSELFHTLSIRKEWYVHPLSLQAWWRLMGPSLIKGQIH